MVSMFAFWAPLLFSMARLDEFGRQAFDHRRRWVRAWEDFQGSCADFAMQFTHIEAKRLVKDALGHDNVDRDDTFKDPEVGEVLHGTCACFGYALASGINQ